MKPFYTVTNSHTQFCNDRSRRYDDEGEAVEAARRRIANGDTKSVIIMKSVAVVEAEAQPSVVKRIEDPAQKPAQKPAIEWANHDNLTDEQVEVSYGWRLLTAQEYAETKAHPVAAFWLDDKCSLWEPDCKRWTGEMYAGCLVDRTYRTKEPLP